MVLRLNSTPAAASPAQNSDFIFSQREDSMFKDIRLRRAASMLYDRDLYIETFFSTKEFTDAGIAVDTMWTSHLPVQCLNWNDPRNKDFGEAAKWFKYDPAEAKKLLAASGFSGKFPFAWRGLVGNANFNDTGLVVSNMLEQGGMPLERNPLNENDWRAWKTRGDENYSGMFQSTSHGFNDDSLLVSKYTPQGTDRVSNRPIPGVTDAVLKIQSELDLKKRNEMIKQMQRQLADLMLDMPQETQQRQFTVHWPWLKNWGVFFSNGFSNDSSSGRPYTEYWYDASLKT
jgi:ABC-type transport system substrate-binding protein